MRIQFFHQIRSLPLVEAILNAAALNTTEIFKSVSVSAGWTCWT